MKFYTKWAPLLAISLLSAIFGYFMTKPMDKLAIFGISIGDSRENVELLTSQEFSGKVLIFVAKDGGQLQVRLGQNDEVEGINAYHLNRGFADSQVVRMTIQNHAIRFGTPLSECVGLLGAPTSTEETELEKRITWKNGLILSVVDDKVVAMALYKKL